MLIYFFFKLKFVTELFYVSMPNICAALNCRTGYKNEPVNADVALHKFPLNNPTLLNQWTRRISRDGFQPNKHHRLCTKHFRQEDVVTNSIDTNKWRKRPSSALKCIQLKEGAIPCMFESPSTQALPSYVSSFSLPVERITTVSYTHLTLPTTPYV